MKRNRNLMENDGNGMQEYRSGREPVPDSGADRTCGRAPAYRRLTAAVLAVSILFSIAMLSGCGSEQVETAESTAAAAAEVTEAAEAEETEEPEAAKAAEETEEPEAVEEARDAEGTEQPEETPAAETAAADTAAQSDVSELEFYGNQLDTIVDELRSYRSVGTVYLRSIDFEGDQAGDILKEIITMDTIMNLNFEDCELDVQPFADSEQPSVRNMTMVTFDNCLFIQNPDWLGKIESLEFIDFRLCFHNGENIDLSVLTLLKNFRITEAGSVSTLPSLQLTDIALPDSLEYLSWNVTTTAGSAVEFLESKLDVLNWAPDGLWVSNDGINGDYIGYLYYDEAGKLCVGPNQVKNITNLQTAANIRSTPEERDDNVLGEVPLNAQVVYFYDTGEFSKVEANIVGDDGISLERIVGYVKTEYLSQETYSGGA